VSGVLSLLTGTTLGLVVLAVPGAQVVSVAIPFLMIGGAGMVGIYAGVNFLYGTFTDIWKLSLHYYQERGPLYEYWLKREEALGRKPGFLKRLSAWPRYVFFPALTQSLFDLCSRTKNILDDLSQDVVPYIESLSHLKKLKRLSDLVGRIKLGIFPKRNPDIAFKGVETEFYEKIRGLNENYESFQDALDGERKTNLSLTRQELLTKLQESINKRPKPTPNKDLEAAVSEQEDSSRKYVFFRTLGNLALAIGVSLTILASFPIIAPAIALSAIPSIMIGMGAVSVGIYAFTNFVFDTKKSLGNIYRKYRNEKETVFEFFRQENGINPSIFNLKYINARMQLIYFPALLHAISDLILNLQNAILESTSERFLTSPDTPKASRLLNLIQNAQNGWIKAFGKPPMTSDFEEKEKILLGSLVDLGYPSFEEGVKSLKSKATLMKAVTKKYKDFNEKLLNKKQNLDPKEYEIYRNMAIEDGYRRLKAYQRAIENLIPILSKVMPEKSKEEIRKTAINRVNDKHKFGIFERDIIKFIDLDEPEETPDSDREFLFLRVLGSLSLATGIFLSIISIAVPGLPVIVIPTLMGVGAGMMLSYVGINFGLDTIAALFNIDNHIKELEPLFEIWVTNKKIKPGPWQHFYLKLQNVYLAAAIKTINKIASKLDENMFDIDEASKGIQTEEEYLKKSSKTEKQKKVKRFFNLLDSFQSEFDPSIDDFEHTTQVLKALLVQMGTLERSRGYSSFDDALEAFQKGPPPISDEKEAIKLLNNSLINELNTFKSNLNEKLKQNKDLTPSEAQELLIAEIYAKSIRAYEDSIEKYQGDIGDEFHLLEKNRRSIILLAKEKDTLTLPQLIDLWQRISGLAKNPTPDPDAKPDLNANYSPKKTQ
jgi:hypothetical protein